jgi:hypothetical protein
MKKASIATRTPNMAALSEMDFEHHVSACVDVVINTRDFCGNEAEAIADYCADEGIKATGEFIHAVRNRANHIWRRHQKAAGVKPKYYRY